MALLLLGGLTPCLPCFASETSRSYDDLDQLQAENYGSGRQTTSVYDEIGNLISFNAVGIVSNPPIVMTRVPSSLFSTFAQLNGSVNPQGSSASVWFDWGTTPSYGATTVPKAIGAEPVGQSFIETLAGLAVGQVYHYRIVASNEFGLVSGSDQIFSTKTSFVADLAVSKLSPASPIDTGANASYTIVVSNRGPNAATGVVLLEKLKGVFSFVSATPSQGTQTYSNATLKCELGTIAANSVVTVNMMVAGVRRGWIITVATVDGSSTDLEMTNNKALSEIQVVFHDHDGDGISDALDPDDDNDGMPDAYEIANGFNPLDSSDATGDSDGDGFKNIEEYQGNSDPRSAASTPPAVFRCGWEWVNPTPQGSDLLAVTEGDGTIVAVGGAGTIVTSVDGVTWTLRNWESGYDLRDVVYTGGSFLAVGTKGKILASIDGITWTEQSSGSTNDFNGVVWNGSQSVAVGTNGAVYVSTGSGNWVSRSLPSAYSCSGVAWNGQRFVLVTQNGYFFTTTNGVSWSAAYVSGFSMSRVIWNGSIFVACGSSGRVATSIDGLTWTLTSTDTTSKFLSAAWGNSQVLVGTATGYVYRGTASDTNWAQVAYLTNGIYGIWRTPTQFVAVGLSGRIWTSPDGSQWTNRRKTLTSVQSTDLRHVIWTGTNYLAVGGGIYTSLDGSTWDQQVSATTEGLATVVKGPDRFVAIGANYAHMSFDGVFWFDSGSFPVYMGTGLPVHLVWNGKQYVVAGPKLLTSTNGVDWAVATNAISESLSGIAWNGQIHVAVGELGRVLTSSNGGDWAVQQSITPYWLNDVIWTGSGFVAVGQHGTVITSPDGTNWQARTTGTIANLRSIAWSGAELIAVGQTTLVSSDGIVWREFPAPTQVAYISYPDNFFGSVAIGRTRFVAVGSGGAIARNSLACSELAISLSDSVDPAALGDSLDYDIAVTNRGPLDASAANINMTLPAGFQLLTSSDPLSTTVTEETNVTITVNGLSSGRGSSYRLTAKVGPQSLFAGENIRTVKCEASVSSSQGSFQSGLREDFELTEIYRLEAATTPVITTLSTNQSVELGQVILLKGSATGIPTPSLQWSLNGTNLTGQTAGELRIAAARSSDAGAYILTASNLSGTATRVTFVTVLDPPPRTIYPVILRGNWDWYGFHTNTDLSTPVGHRQFCFFGCSHYLYSSFLVFNLTNAPLVKSATLRLKLANYASTARGKAVLVNDVLVPTERLTANAESDVEVFNDLAQADGAFYGSASFGFTNIHSFSDVRFDASGVANINAMRGTNFALGLSPASFTTSQNDYLAFNTGAEPGDHQLILEPYVADLSTALVCNQPHPNEQNIIEITTTIQNLGPDTAQNVIARFNADARLVLSTVSPSKGTYDATGQWSLGTLPSGSNATLRVQALVAPGTYGQPLGAMASIIGTDSVDLVTNNNEATVMVTPRKANVSTLAGSESIIVAGGKGAFTLRGFDLLPGGPLTLRVSNLPPWVSAFPSSTVSGFPADVTISFNPPTGQSGTNQIDWTVTDEMGFVLTNGTVSFVVVAPHAEFRQIAWVNDSAGQWTTNGDLISLSVVAQGCPVGVDSNSSLLNHSGFLEGFVLHPELDHDGDGVCDENDPDDDNDGLTDITELMGSAFSPATPTDPMLADSDGDGCRDGAEAMARTNPLDSNSRFAINHILRTNNVVAITWQGKAGLHYLVQGSETLQGLATNPQTLSTFTSTNGTGPWQDSESEVVLPAPWNTFFFRISIQP
jgi:uncharacterized repeat protein (TIGR01451 family)